MLTCKKCNRTYKRTYCEYCKREERWKPDPFYEWFTPRIKQDLINIPMDVSKDLPKIKTGMFIEGVVGSGKTLYAAHLTLARIKLSCIEQTGPKSFKFITVPDLLLQIKNSYNSNDVEQESVIIQELSEVDWLVLDDLSAEKITEWTLNILYLIINHRYEYLKTTVFTSNLDADELLVKLGDERIISRINGMCVRKEMKPQDFRQL